MKKQHLTTRFIFSLILAGLLAIATPTTAQEERPMWLPPEDPTEVYFEIIIIDIPEINERQENYTIEGSLFLEWSDDRLAFAPAEIGADYIVYHNSEATKQLLTEMWSPVIEFENSRGQRRISNVSLAILADGTVYYEEHFVIALGTDLDLRKFPFDTQHLQINVISFFYPAVEMVFSEESKVIFRPNYEMNEWTLVGEPATNISIRAAYGLEIDEENLLFPLSYAQFTINLARNAGFYVWKLMVPLLIITSLSWASFWRKPAVAPRASMTFSCMLTVVAYNFVIGNSLPRITYLTQLDIIFILTYAFIALAVVENVYAGHLDDTGHSEAGIRLDKICRWAFPAAYLSLYALLLVRVFFV